MTEKKKIFTKEDQVQKNFRFKRDVAAKLDELSRHNKRTILTTMEILIETEYDKTFPKPTPKK